MMPVCPPHARKHLVFERQTLARGLHVNRRMHTRFLSLFILGAALLAAPAAPASAQELQEDIVTSINGQDTAAVTTKYFNAENCANPSETFYDLSLTNGDGVSQAYLWAGTEQAGCEQVSNRTDQLTVCAEIGGNPQTVGDNATMTGLNLQALVDTGIFDCANTALEGRTYWIYSFRDADPGGTDVSVDGFGVAPITIDVTPPEELDITSSLQQEGSTFNVSWSTPTDSQSIAQYKMYASATDDPDAALAGGVVSTAGQNAKSISVSAAALGLAEGEQIYLFVSAVDFAAVTVGDGNEGPLSISTLGTAAATGGFCDDPDVDCSGCSASPLVLADGKPSSGLWVIGLVMAIVVGRRLRR
jgi:hypothetical protein